MILGFDHIALNTTNLKNEKEFLENNGYTLLFSEEKIPNNICKKKLINTYTPHHKAAFYRHTNGFKIEITEYNKNKGAINNRFNVDPIVSPEIEILTNDRESELSFWKTAFNFRETESNSNCLFFQSPIKEWRCELKISGSLKKTNENFLDDEGFTCIAFLCTHINDELKKIEAIGAKDTAGPFQLTINNKLLNIAMFRSPTEILCELIQIM